MKSAPDGWILLPPGDAALTRRVKMAGEHWVVAEMKGRKVFSRGVWAPATTIARIRADLEAQRSTESFGKEEGEDAARRREKAQAVYVERFLWGGRDVPGLPLQPHGLASRMARASLIMPRAGGSRTVAMGTKRIPVEQRGRGRGRCLAAASNDRLRRNADPQGEGQAPGSPKNAGPAIPRVA